LGSGRETGSVAAESKLQKELAMKWTLRLGVLLGMACGVTFAQSWSGYLVDSKCYAAEERNVNPRDTETAVDRDRGYEVRYCSPSPKTRVFAIVPPSGERLKLDAVGNARAEELMRSIGKKSMVWVTATGGLSGQTLEVNSLTALK
jgi:hypothetical protein